VTLRDRVAAELPAGAFLRRDRGDALYITDAPRLGWAGVIPGFDVAVRGGIARIIPRAELMGECDFEPDALARELERFRDLPPDCVKLFSLGIKVLESPGEVRIAEYDRRIRQAAAVALRSGGSGGLYACALVLAEAKRRLGYESHLARAFLL
jgi:hypothetical protein